MNIDEIWKSVPSQPEMMASNIGRVRLIERTYNLPNGGQRKTNPAPSFGRKSKSNKNARHYFMMYSNRRLGNMKVHRLVCEAFHGPAPFDGAVVIHLDEDATNNHASNLKWGTQKENLNMPNFIEYCKSRTGDNSPIIKWRKANGLCV